MAKPFVNVLTPADSVGLISIVDAKMLLGISAGDTSTDPQLQMLIDQNSMVLAALANRDTFAKERVEEWWRCVSPVCCPDGTCQVYLTRYPVKLADLESVETPIGYPVDPLNILLEENTGQLVLPGGCGGEIRVVYTGGYDLPDEAPLPLQQAAGLMVQKYRTEATQAATGGSGIRMIAHKDSRIMYYSPKDMAAGGGTTGGSSVSASDSAVTKLLQKYTRYWI
jgi:hypothetical protein